MGRLLDQAFCHQLVGDGGDERPAQIQMIGDGADVHVAQGGQMPDRNQRGVFNAGQSDDGGVPFANGLMAGKEAEQAVDKPPELLIGAIYQHLRPGNCKRSLGHPSLGCAARGGLFRLGLRC